MGSYRSAIYISREHPGMNFRNFPRASGIYQILNTINQKRYIGYATNLQLRCKCHRVELRANKHNNPHLLYAWNLYGERAFEYSVVQLCDKDKLALWEDYWVKVLKTTDDENGYNIRNTDPTGKMPMSEQTKLRISKANKGKKGMLGAANPCYGKVFTDEEKRNLSMKNKGRDMSHIDRSKTSKEVFDWENGIVYSSVRELSRTINISRQVLGSMLNGTKKNVTRYTYI